VKLRGLGGVTVEQVEYTDKLGHRQCMLRLRRHGAWIGDFGTVEELGKHVDLSKLREEENQ
jgi:hypothetical protein